MSTPCGCSTRKGSTAALIGRRTGQRLITFTDRPPSRAFFPSKRRQLYRVPANELLRSVLRRRLPPLSLLLLLFVLHPPRYGLLLVESVCCHASTPGSVGWTMAPGGDMRCPGGEWGRVMPYAQSMLYDCVSSVMSSSSSSLCSSVCHLPSLTNRSKWPVPQTAHQSAVSTHFRAPDEGLEYRC